MAASYEVDAKLLDHDDTQRDDLNLMDVVCVVFTSPLQVHHHIYPRLICNANQSHLHM